MDLSDDVKWLARKCEDIARKIDDLERRLGELEKATPPQARIAEAAGSASGKGSA